MILKQCWILFHLKWTLLRRSWNKRDFWGYALLALLFFCGCILSSILSVVFYAIAYKVSKEQSDTGILLLLNGAIAIYLFFYTWGVLMDLQRSDLIDFRKMLILPVSLPMIYLINFLVSMVSPIMLFALPGLLALFAGFYWQEGVGIFFAGIPLALLFMVMMSAWAYYLRGKLAIIMEDKRKRRIAVVILPLCFVALGQLPAFLSQITVINGDHWLAESPVEGLLPYILMFDAAIPLFWPAYGIWSFVSGASYSFVVLILFGMAVCTFLGMYRGYVSTLNHYRGGDAERKGSSTGTIKKMPRTSICLPFLSDETSALFLAFYSSFARHPHVRMLIIMPLCLGLFFLFMYRTGAYGGYNMDEEAAWIPMAALVWPFLNFSLFLFNIFGVDAQSFVALTLFPVDRRKYIIAKNLALVPFVLGMTFFFIVVSALLVWPPVRMILLSFLLALHLCLLFTVIGNYFSLRFPYRINRDALRQPTRRLRMFFVGLGSTFVVAVMVIPASACMYIERNAVAHGTILARNAGLITGMLLFLLTFFVYLFTITGFGDQLSDRERMIYARIMKDRE